jgi:hypothetical protein
MRERSRARHVPGAGNYGGKLWRGGGGQGPMSRPRWREGHEGDGELRLVYVCAAEVDLLTFPF